MYQFFILSRIENGIFIYHNVDDTTINDRGVSYFIYHVLKNNNIIHSDDVNIFIYEHNLVNKTFDLITLQSKNKGELEEFDKENLENIFYEIIENIGNHVNSNINSENNNNMLVVSYENNNFTTLFKPFVLNLDEKIVIDTIEYIAL